MLVPPTLLKVCKYTYLFVCVHVCKAVCLPVCLCTCEMEGGEREIFFLSQFYECLISRFCQGFPVGLLPYFFVYHTFLYFYFVAYIQTPTCYPLNFVLFLLILWHLMAFYCLFANNRCSFVFLPLNIYFPLAVMNSAFYC